VLIVYILFLHQPPTDQLQKKHYKRLHLLHTHVTLPVHLKLTPLPHPPSSYLPVQSICRPEKRGNMGAH